MTTFDLFLSYRRQSSLPFVEELHAHLTSEVPGYSVFWDLSNLKHSTSWRTDVEQGINSSRAVIAVLGRCSFCDECGLRPIEKDEFLYELALARRLDKPIIPIDFRGFMARDLAVLRRLDPELGSFLADRGPTILDPSKWIAADTGGKRDHNDEDREQSFVKLDAQKARAEIVEAMKRRFPDSYLNQQFFRDQKAILAAKVRTLVEEGGGRFRLDSKSRGLFDEASRRFIDHRVVDELINSAEAAARPPRDAVPSSTTPATASGPPPSSPPPTVATTAASTAAAGSGAALSADAQRQLAPASITPASTGTPAAAETNVRAAPREPVEAAPKTKHPTAVVWPPERPAPADAWWRNRKQLRKGLDELVKRLEPQARALGATCKRTGGNDYAFDGIALELEPGVLVGADLYIDESTFQHFGWIVTSFGTMDVFADFPNSLDLAPAALALRGRLTVETLARLEATGPDEYSVPASPLPTTTSTDFFEAVARRLPQWSAVLLPQMKEVRYSLPVWAWKTGIWEIETSDALIALETAEARQSFAYCFRVGWLLYGEDNIDEAQRYLEAAAALEPMHPGPPLGIAWCNNEREDRANALASFRRALDLSEWGWHTDEAVSYAAWWASKCGDRAFAVLAHQEKVRREPDVSGAWCWLGVGLKRARRFEEAEAALRKSIEIAPGMHAVHSLARLLARRGDFGGARTILDALRKADGSLTKTSVALLKEIDERERRRDAGETDDDDDDGDEGDDENRPS